MSLVDYDSSSENEDTPNRGLMKAAPETTNLSLVKTTGELDVSGKPIQGPQNPFENTRKRKVVTGQAEEEAFEEAAFKRQHRNYQMMGYARNPMLNSEQEFVGDQIQAQMMNGGDVTDIQITNKQRREIKAKRQKKGDPSVLDGDNAYKGPWAKYAPESSSSASSSSEDEQENSEADNKKEEVAGSDEDEEVDSGVKDIEETTEFHGQSEVDYLGRTYMHVPQDLGIKLDKEPGEQFWNIPKKIIHTWKGHPGGTTRVQFFPRSGHLILSGGKDGKLMLWDVYHDRQLLRSFMGHSKEIKDFAFNSDGTQIVSCSADKMVKLWDTESGKCLNKWTIESVPNCVVFNPQIADAFLVGCQSGNILQYTTVEKEPVEQYNHHLQSVLSLVFVEGGKRFMSSSMDRSVRVWDWQVSMPVKFLTDPVQPIIKSTCLHPSQSHVAGLGIDSKVHMIGAVDRFKFNKKRHFSGVSGAGYVLGLTFSPDGKYLLCGDASGGCIVWDWKKYSLVTKIEGHKKACLDISVHPQESTKLATAGLDSVIHLWE